jgi:hypothetical protein
LHDPLPVHCTHLLSRVSHAGSCVVHCVRLPAEHCTHAPLGMQAGEVVAGQGNAVAEP